MAPFYQGWMDNVALQEDDIAGIKSLYGDSDGGITIVKPEDKPLATTKPPPVFKPVKPAKGKGSAICDDPRFDAAAQTVNGNFYVFKGDQYWMLKKHSAYVRGMSTMLW